MCDDFIGLAKKFTEQINSVGVDYCRLQIYGPALRGVYGLEDSFFVTIDDVDRFIRNKKEIDKFFASKHGVSVEDYIRWEKAEHHIRCSAFTKNGKRCANYAWTDLTAKKFIEHEGDFCGVHTSGPGGGGFPRGMASIDD